MTMSRRGAMRAAALAGLGGLTGCGPVQHRVGTLVGHWSQSEAQGRPNDYAGPPVLVTDPAGWQTAASRLPERLAADPALAGNAFETSVLVVGSYPRCREQSRVLDEGGGRLVFEVHNPEPNVSCVWSPLQIDVWRVDLSSLAARPTSVSRRP